MASLRLLLLILASLVLVFATPSLVTYVPECAQDCILKSINGTCTGPEDSQCLCNNMRTVGSGSVPCASAACNNSTEEIALELRSGFIKYCSDAGVSVASSATAIPSFGWGGSGSWGSSATATSSSTPTSSSTGVPATGEADSSANTSTSGGGGSSSLSTGGIAGIAVGGGIGVISITGGLLLLAFRLGRNHNNRKKDEAEPSGHQEGGDGGDPESGTSANEAVAADKAQLEGKPLNELPTEYTLSGFDPVKELPTHERPAELSADPLPRYPADETPVLSGSPWR